MNDGISIITDNDIILYLLGQNDPLPKCNVFVGIPRFDNESVSKSDDDEEEPEPQIQVHLSHLRPHSNNNNRNNRNKIHNHLYLKQSHSEQRHNTYSPISPLPRAISFDISDNNNDINNHIRLNNNNNNNNISSLMELKSIINVNNDIIDIYDGHKEYICCFNNIIKKMILTMYDIAKYNDMLFRNKFLLLFDYKLNENELLQLDVYNVLGKQYIEIKLPLWSYDSKHFHIKGVIIEQEFEEEEEEEEQEEEEEENNIYNLENIFNNLEIDFNLQQKEFEDIISSINISTFDNNNNIYLWKKYQSDIIKIENDIILFTNQCYARLNCDLYNNINIKCIKLKEICSNKLNIINKIQNNINCDELEIIEIEKAIRRLTIQKMKYKQSLKTKEIQIKKEENILNKSQNKLEKLKYFENNKYEITKKQLNVNIETFKNDKQIKINNIKKYLHKIWKKFELNYFQWDIDEALQWILCIENFYFSNNKFNNFIQTLKTHQFIGKNLKELKSHFTLNVMGLKNNNDQQILIKNINRIINKSTP